MTKFNSAADVETWARTGEVIGATGWSETHVSSTTTGGGGQLHHGSGYVQPTTTHTSSTSTEVSQFFLKTADGKEVPVKEKNINFPVRDGHVVTVVYVKHKEDQNGWSVAFYNHSTETFRSDNAAMNSVYEGKIGCAQFAIAALIVGIFVLLPGLTGMGLGGVIIGLIAAIGYLVVSASNSSKSRKEIHGEVERQARQLIEAAEANLN